MKRTVFVILILFFQQVLVAQNDFPKMVDKKPEPKEGLPAFYSQFKKVFNTSFLPENVTEINLRLKFNVEKDGSLTNIQAGNDEYGISNEAKRVLLQMGKWQPAKLNEEAVGYAFVMGVNLDVRKDETKNDKPYYVSKEEIDAFIKSLDNITVQQSNFEFNCNCELVNFDAKEQVYYYESKDKLISYSVSVQKKNATENKSTEAVVEKNNVTKGYYLKWLEVPHNEMNYFSRYMFFENETFFGTIKITSENRQLAYLTLDVLKFVTND